jgi:hypothetical protein
MSLEADALLDEIKARTGSDLSSYSEIYSKAVKESSPVFLSKEYEQFFWQCALTIPNWLPRVVAACAVTEGNGAHALLDIWSRVHGDPEAEDGLLQHAKDEAAHARLFLKLARLAFDENYPNGNLDDIEQSLRPIERDNIKKDDSRPAVSEQMIIDYMMQLNIVEIRTRKHLQMMAPMYFNLAPVRNRPQVEKILHGLERDEMTHIAYTASVIDRYASGRDRSRLCGVFCCRMDNYNQHTIDHCNAAKNDYGQGKIPMLFAPACGGACRLSEHLTSNS